MRFYDCDPRTQAYIMKKLKQYRGPQPEGPFPRVGAVYKGFTEEHTGIRRIMVTRPGVRTELLDPRSELMNHSPDGFQWGYSGSGPAQAALAIMADFLGDDERTMRVYQHFKSEFIAGIQTDSWEITGQQILDSDTYKALVVSDVMDT